MTKILGDVPSSFLKSPDFRKTGYLKSTEDYLQGIDFSKVKGDYSTKCYPGSKVNDVNSLKDNNVIDFSSVNEISSAFASNNNLNDIQSIFYGKNIQ